MAKNDPIIQVTRSGMPPMEEYVREIASLWDSCWLTNMGEKHERLEAALAAYLGVPRVTLFTNGHLALEASIRALGLTGEVITTPFTFASTTHAIVRCGLTPVFCDVEPGTCTLDPEKLEALITPRTSAILPVHVYGSLCRAEAIQAVADRHGLKVLYDAAHAFGVQKDGVGAGCFGDASMFSFHATKVFHTIEGGAVAYRDEGLQMLLHYQRDFGIAGPENVADVGGNGKMNEFQAAMGLCNLRHVDGEIQARGRAAERYRARLTGVPGLRLIAPQTGVTQNYAYFPVFFDGYRKSRDEMAELLKENGVVPRKYFYPITSAFPCYADRFDPTKTPVALRLSEQVLTLPMYGALSEADVDRICDVILGV